MEICAAYRTCSTGADTEQAHRFEPNAFGRYEVHDNVHKWVEDCNALEIAVPTDGSALFLYDCELRAQRGGSWAEMEVHLADPGEREARNHRNGTSRKTVNTGSERIVLDIPRDRQGRFDPVLIGKYQRRFPGFDEKIIAMYARGMSTRYIQAHIEELYGIGVSAPWSRRSPMRCSRTSPRGRTALWSRSTRSCTSMRCG